MCALSHSWVTQAGNITKPGQVYLVKCGLDPTQQGRAGEGLKTSFFSLSLEYIQYGEINCRKKSNRSPTNLVQIRKIVLLFSFFLSIFLQRRFRTHRKSVKSPREVCKPLLETSRFCAASFKVGRTDKRNLFQAAGDLFQAAHKTDLPLAGKLII